MNALRPSLSLLLSIDREIARHGKVHRTKGTKATTNQLGSTDDFLFELTREEIRNISQSVICSSTLKHARNVYAITEQGVASGKVPDPKSQVEQITIALSYKFMDDMDRQSEELGGKFSL